MQATLNLVHVFSAVLWAGGTLFLALFVSRAAQAAGPGAAPFMGALVTRTRVVDAMTWASIFTVGSGLWLWIRRFGSAMPSGFDGVAISVGALAGISALVVGVARQRPTIMGMRRLIEEIGNQAPSE